MGCQALPQQCTEVLCCGNLPSNDLGAAPCCDARQTDKHQLPDTNWQDFEDLSAVMRSLQQPSRST